MRYKMRQWFTLLMSLVMLLAMLPVAALAESAVPPEEPEPVAQTVTADLPEPEEDVEEDAGPDPQEDTAPSPSPEAEEDPEATPEPEEDADTEASPSPEAAEDADAGPEADMDPSPDAGSDLSPAPETDPAPGAAEQVQALIDALPDPAEITEDTRAHVEEQLAAIDAAKLALSEEERAALDTARYEAAAAAILALDGQDGADEPMAIDSGTLDGGFEWSLAGTTLTLTGSDELDLFHVGSHPWDDREIETVIVKGEVTLIGDSCFENWYKLQSVTLPEGLRVINRRAFSYCTDLIRVVLPDSLIVIEDNAFARCTDLYLRKLPESVESIGDRAFSDCRHLMLKSLPKNLIQIGSSTFLNCPALALTELPDGLKYIESSAFSDCTGLTDLSVPASVERVGQNAFKGCNELTLTFSGMTAPEAETGAFEGVKEIRVSAGATGYTAEGWPQEKIRYIFSGPGTEDEPYRIPDKATLEAFRADVNNGEDFAGKYFMLTADIDLGGVPWTPIGPDFDHSFEGTFDGGGHTISGLYINDTSKNYQGLFGAIGAGSTVKNLAVSGSVTGGQYVGGIVGENSGTVENCSSSVSVSGRDSVGGIVGLGNMSSTVTNCCNTGSVTGGTSSVGGIVGYAYAATVANCYNCGKISGQASAGGIAGDDVYTTVTNCYYLDTCGAGGKGTPKTKGEFASGEIAWLLQGGQASQVWGQSLGGDAPDEYPVLSSDGSYKTYRVTFKADWEPDYEGHLYANPGKGTGVVLEIPRDEGYVPVKWSLTEDADGAAFTGSTPVYGDMTVYAIHVLGGTLPSP